MHHDHSNIVLIGMPGAGKSTVGVLLAKRLAKNFVDTDLLIQSAEGRPLQDIVDHDGYMALREIEERVLLGMTVENHVVATGGSAAYSDAAMRHLKRNGLVVFLDISLDSLRSRVRDYDTRGIARRPDQSFEDLFDERFRLYSKYADIVVDEENLTPEETVERIVTALRRDESAIRNP